HSFERFDLAAYRGDLRRSRLTFGDIFHHPSNHRRAKPIEFRHENHRRDRDRERDWHRNFRYWQETSAGVNAALDYPPEVFRKPAGDWNKDDLGNFIGMQRSKFVPKC